MPRIIYKELRENMSSFKTKTIALIASSLIVAVAGLSFATTPAFAKKKKNYYIVRNTQQKGTDIKVPPFKKAVAQPFGPGKTKTSVARVKDCKFCR